jgi:N-glycosylase/DNA lyase
MNEYCHLTELHADFGLRRDAIRKRLAEFSAVHPADYFYELVYCLLTPQSSAANAARAVEELRSAGFGEQHFDPVAILRRKDHYIRFHNTKARHLERAKDLFPEINTRLLSCPPASQDADVRALRLWLTEHVSGLGWKESSHFLRNIGYRNLAILDRHILRNLQRHGVMRSIPTTLSPKRYVDIEQRFVKFAKAAGIDMDELDLLFWSRETGEIRK